MVKEWCWFSQINVFQKFVPHWVQILYLSFHFDIVPIHRIVSLLTNKHSQFGAFSHPQFVSCTSFLLEQMYDFQKRHNVPPEVDFESSRSPAKSESWNNPSLHCLAVLPTWQYCLYSHAWWIYEINRFRRLSQALVHFVMARASLFIDHKISGRPILATYKHFRTIWEHTCDNSPTDFVSSSKWWSSMHGVDTL